MPNLQDTIVEVSTKRPAKRQKQPKAKSKPKRKVKSLKKELDTIFSRFIRERDKHTCYTCNIKLDPKKSQNGHFVPRQYLATRYDEVNNHCQCYACNVLYNGQPSVYALRLERDYGKGTVEMLESKRKLVVKDFPYEYWIEVYQEKLKQLQNERVQAI